MYTFSNGGGKHLENSYADVFGSAVRKEELIAIRHIAISLRFIKQ